MAMPDEYREFGNTELWRLFSEIMEPSFTIWCREGVAPVAPLRIVQKMLAVEHGEAAEELCELAEVEPIGDALGNLPRL